MKLKHYGPMVLSNYHVECLFDHKYDHSDFDSNSLFPSYVKISLWSHSLWAAGQSSPRKAEQFHPTNWDPFFHH